ncbi:hypothetical protein F2Q68_00017029 [Brassica cretica]|uniref:Retrotransposon Copia-like N-terminal domain-containing protein n=1 Tax=Brassica cretica TaxID=69181 RepID=A0A8S9HP95_BRACR|nr:hypothetical protein F2Q68_00017029 [Brassica cretica]
MGEEKWVQEDQRAVEIIHMSLSDSILEAYVHCGTAKELWESLKAVYGNISNPAVLKERLKEFHSFEVDGNPASEASGTLVSISTSNSSGRYNVLFFSVSVITHH